MLRTFKAGMNHTTRAIGTLSGVPSARRSIVYVVNNNGSPQIGAETMTHMPWYHSPSRELAGGPLEPKELGAATPKALQPKAFGNGSPQFARSPTGVMAYTGSYQSNPRLYQMHANPFARNFIDQAVNSGESNEFVIIDKAAMGFSSRNAEAMGENDKTAIQLTAKAIKDKEFMVEMREVPDDEKNEVKREMIDIAQKLDKKDGKLRAESRAKDGGVPANVALNAAMKSSESSGPTDIVQ